MDRRAACSGVIFSFAMGPMLSRAGEGGGLLR
jgi:hypothetical protein